MIGDAIAGVIGQIITRVWPDESQKAAALLEIEKLKQAGEFKAIDAELERSRQQTEVNKVEASSSDPFTSRARPFILWTCGAAMGYAAIVDPFARFIATVGFGYSGTFPEVDTAITMQVLLGLLGLSGYRSVEKIKGVAR